MYKDQNGNWHLDENETRKPRPSAPRPPFSLPSLSRFTNLSSSSKIGLGLVVLLLVLALAVRHFSSSQHLSSPPQKPVVAQTCLSTGALTPELALADTVFTLKSSPIPVAALCYYAPQRAAFTLLAQNFATTGLSLAYTGAPTVGISHSTTLPGQPKTVILASIPYQGSFQGCVTNPKPAPALCQTVTFTDGAAPHTALAIKTSTGWFLLFGLPTH